MATTLLHTVCENLVTTVLNAMHLTKTTHAFMVGSFVSRKSVQDMVIEKFEKRKWLDAISSAGIVSIVAFSTNKNSPPPARTVKCTRKYLICNKYFDFKHSIYFLQDSANHHIHILHNGSHLGALGAMLSSKN